MAVLTAITSWTVADVQHFARRAGFGLSPTDAAALQAQALGAAIDAWVDGTGPTHDLTSFNTALGTADMVTEPLIPASTTDTANGTPVPVAAVTAPHAFLVDAPNAWRNNLSTAQAYLAWRMQHSPYAFQERMALFYHNLFATGWHKVNNAALMLKQIQLFRTDGLDKFDDLLVKVSKDPAMCVWLDSVLNNAAGTSIPNENYARESMELYSLGADNGYNQTDITQLALALSGWSFTFGDADYIKNPASPSQKYAADGHFKVYDGTAISPDTHVWWGGTSVNSYNYHRTGTISLFGVTGIDITTTAGGYAKGENALRTIVTAKGINCSQFLAKRLLTHFVTTGYTTTDQDDVALMIRTAGFDMRVVMKTLLKSQFFFAPANRWALAEGPVSWIVRGAKMLCPSLAAVIATPAMGYPAWRLFTSNANTFDQMGMKLLDASAPNGWHEHTAWLNSNTMRYRTKAAAALALDEVYFSIHLFPSYVTTDWFPASLFPTGPANAQAVYDRLVLLLQPGPIAASVTTAWLAALWPSTFTWTAADQTKARELAFLILCSPAGQLY